MDKKQILHIIDKRIEYIKQNKELTRRRARLHELNLIKQEIVHNGNSCSERTKINY